VANKLLVWCIYDISKNKIRNKIVKIVMECGLYRVQKSVFLGEINKNDLDSLVLQSDELIDKKTDSVYIFPMCEADFKKAILQGQAFDREMVTDKVKALFI
jgi:CRISPR-associated protein Cas2